MLLRSRACGKNRRFLPRKGWFVWILVLTGRRSAGFLLRGVARLADFGGRQGGGGAVKLPLHELGESAVWILAEDIVRALFGDFAVGG